MQYMGGKTRVANDIIKVITSGTPKTPLYFEPFMGSAALFYKMAPNFEYSIGADAMVDLTMMWQALQSGWIPPDSVSRDVYASLRNAEPSAIRGFVGFGLSFGGKWFGGYASNNQNRDYCGVAKRNVLQRASNMRNSMIINSDYRVWHPRGPATVYCDPPYAGTTGYRGAGPFDNTEFWRTVRQWANDGCHVYVSEYTAPDWAQVVWEKPVQASLKRGDNSAVVTEKLFKVNP